MKSLRFNIVLVFIITSMIACKVQTKISEDVIRRNGLHHGHGMFPFYENGKWGYNAYSGELHIKAQFDEAYLEVGGLNRVKKNGKYGFINRMGKWIARPVYQEASDFGFTSLHQHPHVSKVPAAHVKKGNSQFYIDTDNKEIKYPSINIKKDIPKIFNPPKNDILDHILLKQRERHELVYRYCIIDTLGVKLSQFDTTNFKIDSVIYYGGNHTLVRSEGRWARISNQELRGKTTVKEPNAGMNNMGRYIEKDIVVESSEDYQPNVNFEFEDIDTKNGLRHLIAMKNGYWGIMGLNGEAVVPFDYLKIIETGYHFALVEYEEGRQGYLSYYFHPNSIKNYSVGSYDVIEHFKRRNNY